MKNLAPQSELSRETLRDLIKQRALSTYRERRIIAYRQSWPFYKRAWYRVEAWVKRQIAK